MSEPGPLLIDVAGFELDDEDREMLAHPVVGGVILFTRNFGDMEQLAALVAEIRGLRPQLLVTADYEGGRVQRFRAGFTRIPPMRALGAAYDRDHGSAIAAAREIGWLIGAELGTVDIDLPFAPVLDLDRGISGVIGDRALHRDPDAVIALAAAFCAGLSEAGTAATGKHFPGHGAVAADSHAELPVDGRGAAELESDLRPFTALLRRGLASVMMAHIRYPAVDDEPASLSPRWIGERLRGALAFDGAVFCDDLSMGGAAAAGDYPQRAGRALAAGCDILPVCNNRPAAAALLEALPAWENPARAPRVAALRRRRIGGWPALRADTRWRAAREQAARLLDSDGSES